MALQEAEALQLMRAALENPHGTAQERSQRLLKAWSFLRRSAIPNADGDAGLTAKEEKKRLKEDRRDWRKLKRRRREEKRDNDEEEKLLLYAARLGDVEQISKLLKLGVYVSCKDDSGYSALHWASLYGHIDGRVMGSA